MNLDAQKGTIPRAKLEKNCLQKGLATSDILQQVKAIVQKLHPGTTVSLKVEKKMKGTRPTISNTQEVN